MTEQNLDSIVDKLRGEVIAVKPVAGKGVAVKITLYDECGLSETLVVKESDLSALGDVKEGTRFWGFLTGDGPARGYMVRPVSEDEMHEYA